VGKGFDFEVHISMLFFLSFFDMVQYGTDTDVFVW